MSISALNIISDSMKELNIPYAFAEWKGKVSDRYFIGEYQEVESLTKEEDGYQETSFILTGTTRGSWLSLEKDKESIEKYFSKSLITNDGSCVAIFYANSFVVPTGDAELKRIQINLTIKEWKVI